MQGQSSSFMSMPLLLLLAALVAVAIGAVLALRRPGARIESSAKAVEPVATGSVANPNRTVAFAVLGAGVLLAAIAMVGLMKGSSGPSRAVSGATGNVWATASGVTAAGPALPVTPPATTPVAGAQQPVADTPVPAQAGSAGAVVPGNYSCSAFMGIPPNGHLQPIPGFTVGADGSYAHQDGVAGTITVSGNVVEFHGGALDGQAATFDSGPTGRGTIHLYNESRSRTVIDCEG